MKRRISVQTDGIFQPCGVDEGMRLISRGSLLPFPGLLLTPARRNMVPD